MSDEMASFMLSALHHSFDLATYDKFERTLRYYALPELVAAALNNDHRCLVSRQT